MNVFRIIPELRILRPTFPRKSASKYLDYDNFSGLCFDYLRALNLKLFMFKKHTASLGANSFL